MPIFDKGTVMQIYAEHAEITLSRNIPMPRCFIQVVRLIPRPPARPSLFRRALESMHAYPYPELELPDDMRPYTLRCGGATNVLINASSPEQLGVMRPLIEMRLPSDWIVQPAGLFQWPGLVKANAHGIPMVTPETLI